ncbi:MAG: Xylose isomerase domain protein barrel [Bryobacterales bacterium]|nr:Xylose isomerase domain protein barrel [Bryobacterales bacterium]
MTRRDVLTAAGSAALFSAAAGTLAAEPIPNPKGPLGMGGAPTSFGARRAGRGGRPGGSPREANYVAPPFSDEFFDYCHSLGLAGAEMGDTPTDPADIAKFKEKVKAYNMHVTFNIPLPRNAADVDRFATSVKTAKEIGAHSLHAALTGRRYEEMKSLAEYTASFENNQKMVALATPILNRFEVRLALENHKGWAAVEQAAWMKRVNSPFVGVHFDFGNNVSFMEDPMFTLETLKPWIFGAHIKDMGVAPYEDGFLLSEVPFGEGFLDLKKMVDVLRQKDPKMIFDLEMITRDPLKIPIYTDRYWITFKETPPQQVAKLMELIQKKSSKKPLPTTTGLDPAARLKLEEDYNLACIRYARQNLGL